MHSLDSVNEAPHLLMKRSDLVMTDKIKKRLLVLSVASGGAPQVICCHDRLALRHWEILAVLQTEDGISISMSSRDPIKTTLRPTLGSRPTS